jgi:hypothetical protein
METNTESSVKNDLGRYVGIYFLLKRERLCVNIKYDLYKVLIRPVITSACPTWEFAEDSRLLKLQGLQNTFLCAIDNVGKRILLHDTHVALKFPYVYHYTTKLYTKPAEVIQYYQNPNIRATGQEEAMQRKYTVTEYDHLIGNASVNTFPR